MPIGLPRIRPLAAAVAALWLCAAPAWAGGGGGEDAGTVQSFLNSVCGALGMTSCPQLPTVTQGVLEIAGLVYARPEAIRRANNIPPGNVSAGNPSPIPANPVVPLVLPVTPSAFANLALTPLAFIRARAGGGPATPTRLTNHKADSFFSAVTTFGTVQGTVQPQVLNLFYDDLSRTNPAFTTGQTVALFSLPLVVLNSNGTERPVPTTLKIVACAKGPAGCLIANATGDFLGNGTQQTQSAGDLGLDFALVFGRSPAATRSHAIFEIQVPLVVTAANDPVYFSFSSPQVGIIGTVTFAANDIGFTPTKGGILPAGASIGIAPYPAPVTTAPIPPGPASSTFGFCANLPDNGDAQDANQSDNGDWSRAGLHPAVAAFLQIATDGETLLGSPLGTSTSPTLQCPF